MSFLGANRGSFGGGGGSEAFPNPFIDVASMNMPQSMRNALQWAEFVFMSSGTYRMALERIISYFLTDVNFDDEETSDDEKNKWHDFLTDTLDVLTNLQAAYRDYVCYGNSFSSILVPFKRFLTCPKCFSSYQLRVVYNNKPFAFAWADSKFTATCPKCSVGSGYRGPWIVDDKPDDLEKKITIKRWSPHEIELLSCYYTDQTAYLWRIPEDYKQQVRRGNLYHLERVPIPVLEAIKRNQMFRFNPDVIFHMKEPTLAGIRNRGWGIPRTLSNFRQIYYVQVLRRYNEAIALDYVIPFRLITPAPRPGAGGGGGGQGQMADPMLAYNMGDFRSQVSQMIRRRRRDPASWQVLGFPVQYQILGGDASKLAPVELMNAGTEQLLNDVGIPAELFKGTLTLQTSAPALRLFEATWHSLVHSGNKFINWVVSQTSQVLSWEVVKASMMRVTIADDIAQKQALLQMYVGQQISGSTAMKPLGLDWRTEQRRMGEEALYSAQQSSKVQELSDQAGFAQQMAKGNITPGQGGAPQQGGAQQGGGGGGQQGGAQGQPGAAGMQGPVDQYLANSGPETPQSPQEMVSTADSLAQELLGLPDSIKRNQLNLLKKKNEVLHSIVRARMDSLRNSAKVQGGQQVISQQFGQGQGGGGQGQ